ncbi:MarR family winged helix-turn-helix transcriptional regulator [Nonomuraea sp. SYSU D8015]|uniref:MarR family winged helix-turn-helix transcriptional regulator n=1 Tax=Nonomuraea sp. SYSU D8015 TaxID=2593644 RepID=UPI00166052C4|nr:MarR family transcriptional regulator [Nonomuraea sp. SYSU D8015]
MHHTTHRPGFPDDDLRRLFRTLVRVGRVLEPQVHGGVAVSFSELCALGELEEAGTLSQQELADRLGLEKSTVSRLTAGMERKGWLVRERDPANRRFYRLLLTSGGRAASEQIGGAFQQVHSSLFESLTPAERDALGLGLRGLIRALREYEKTQPT